MQVSMTVNGEEVSEEIEGRLLWSTSCGTSSG